MDSKSIEHDVIQISSRAISNPPLSENDFKNEMDSPLNYPLDLCLQGDSMKNRRSKNWYHKNTPSFSIQLHYFFIVVNVMYSHLAYLERSCKKAFTSIREWHSRKANISRIATSETFPPRKRHFNVKCLFFKSNIRYILRALFRHTLDGIRFKQYYTNTKTDRWSCALPNISG